MLQTSHQERNRIAAPGENGLELGADSSQADSSRILLLPLVTATPIIN
jgi:hypothetical protein